MYPYLLHNNQTKQIYTFTNQIYNFTKQIYTFTNIYQEHLKTIQLCQFMFFPLYLLATSKLLLSTFNFIWSYVTFYAYVFVMSVFNWPSLKKDEINPKYCLKSCFTGGENTVIIFHIQKYRHWIYGIVERSFLIFSSLCLWLRSVNMMMNLHEI